VACVGIRALQFQILSPVEPHADIFAPSPFISYDSVARNGTRLLNIQSLKDFETDVKKETLPQYAHISPNMLNDGHDTGLKYATNWSRSYLKDLLDNKKFMEKTLILLTYDESETYSKPNHIVSVLLGGAVPDNLKGTKDDTLYTHYSILATLENNWELPNLGRYDVGANVFKLVAEKTGWKNHAKDDPSTVDNSISYGGFLNGNPSNSRPIPPPNLKLVGAGGKGVADIVKREWKLAELDDTPYDGSGHLYDGRTGKDTNAPLYKPQEPNKAN
jgi:acid phosphatase